MSSNHLLSASLYAELFQHNMVSPDGRIIANEQQLQNYSAFLRKQSKDKVTRLYADRKNLVNDVEELLRLDSRTEEEDKLQKELLKEIDLEFDKAGLLSIKEPRKLPERYLGPKEPEKSVFERRIEASVKAEKVLKQDLKKLDDWLEQIAESKPAKDQEEHLVDYKESGKKYRQRTANRMSDMENARKKLIKHHYKEYDENMKIILNRKLPKEKYLSRIDLKKKDAKDKAEMKDLKGKRDGKVMKTKAKKSTQGKIVITDDGKIGDILREAQRSTEDETAVKDAKDRDLTIKAEKTLDNNMTVKDVSKNGDFESEIQTSINENSADDDAMETENFKAAVKIHVGDRDVTSKTDKAVEDNVAVKDICKNGGLASETQTSTVEDEDTETENDKTALKDHVEDRDVTSKTDKAVDDNVAVKDIGKSGNLASETQTSIVEDEDTETENVKTAVKNPVEDRDVTSRADKTVNDNVPVKDIVKNGDLASETQTSIVEGGDTETENAKTAVKDQIEDKDVTITADKTVDDNIAVKDIGKNADLASETQTSIVEDEDTETENVKTAVKDHVEDRDVTITTGKTVDDSVTVKDSDKNGDLASETQTSIVEDKDTKANNVKTGVKDPVEDRDVTVTADKTVDDNVAAKDIGKNEDLASETQTSRIEDISENGHMSTKTKTNVEDLVNVKDNAEVKEAATEATDAVTEAAGTVTDMSNKMNEIKKLLVLTEDTILKVDASDNDVETKAQNDINNNKSLDKTSNAAEKNKEISVIDELKDAIIKATSVVIEATDSVTDMSNKMYEVRKRMTDINKIIDKDKNEIDEAASKSNTDEENDDDDDDDDDEKVEKEGLRK